MVRRRWPSWHPASGAGCRSRRPIAGAPLGRLCSARPMPQAPLILGPPRLRSFGAVNWIGLWTLYVKEVRRFLKVVMQTVAAPVVSTLLFLAIFLLALGGGGRQIAGIPSVEFLLPGLGMMPLTPNPFPTTSSSLVIGKMQGN